jgi:hypothetical protein
MAYQFADGFDNYGTPPYSMGAGYPWDALNNTPQTNADVRFNPPGALPGASLQCGVSNTYIRKNLTSNQATVMMGFGFKTTSLPGSNVSICAWWDTGTQQVSLVLNPNGALQFYRGNAVGTAIGAITPNATIAANTWYGISMSVTVDPSAGAVSCFINGNAVAAISSTGLNTRATTNSYSTQVSIGSDSGNSGMTFRYDDFFCFDSTTGFLNALPSGDTRILTKMPSGAGTYSNWTPNGLGSNFQNAAVQPPSTSDYNANNVSTTKDSYAMQSAGLGVNPIFVMIRASLERDDAGPHTPSLFFRSGTTDGGAVVTPALTSSYLFYDAVVQNDPATSSAWGFTGADSTQIGIIEG